MMVEKIVPPVEELEPTTKTTVERKRHSFQKGVTVRFHCPVDGCLYGPSSERHFSCLKYLKQHYKKVHAAKVFSCERCEAKFVVSSDFKAHDLICGQQFECSCGATYSRREALLTHAKRKQHELPEGQGLKRTQNYRSSEKITSEMTNKTSTILVVLDGAATANVAPNIHKPTLILPKPAPLSTVPLKTVAAMALSELSNYRYLNMKLAVATQTENSDRHANCSCRKLGAVRQDSRSQSQVRRAIKRSAETQTLRGSGTHAAVTAAVPRKRQRRDVASCSTQTASTTSESAAYKVPLRSETTQTEQFPQVPTFESVVYQRDDEYLWQMSDDGSLAATDKLRQTISDLDIDVNFHLVSSGTQTSPSPFQSLTKNPICDRFLDSPLRDYLALDNLPDYPLALSVGEGSQAQQLSSIETQTEIDFEALLMCGAAGGVPNEADIQTQTSEDLESIPYDQLLSHMETQTSDLFSELGNFCNIQTQTAYDFDATASGSVDTQTQTNATVSWRATSGTATQLTNMETQTFLSFLEMVDSPSPLS